METLLSIATKAKLRMQFNRTLSNCIYWFLFIACTLFSLAIIDRVGEAPMFSWILILISSATVLLLIIIMQWSASSFSTIEAASEVDQRLQLHDRISSALASKDIDNPFSKAVLEDALQIVESSQVVSLIPHHFPILIPKSSGLVFGIAFATALLLWSPQWGFFQTNQTTTLELTTIASRKTIESSIDAVLGELQTDADLSEALEEELSELASTMNNNLVDTETLRRDALRKITDVQKRLDEMLKDENALAFDEMLQRMQQLKLPKSGNTLPMIAAMKNGDIDKAKKEFGKLQELMDSTSLSEQERKELEKQLKALANQLEKLSSSSEAVASALSAAGMNSALAKNADAAEKAIENAKNLTESQKEKLLKMLKAQQQADKMCKKLSENCKQCANGKPGSSSASELKKMQTMQMFKTKAELAKSACANAGAKMGGTGGKGKGSGGSNPTKETESAMVAQQTAVSTLEGTIIAKQLFEGGMLTSSESTSEVKDVVLAQRLAAEQAITDEEIPRKYHDLLRHYFGQLEEMAKPSSNNDTQSDD
jgi:hypothetical protein